MKTKSIETILAEILTNQIDRIEYNYNGALRGAGPGYLHDLRVAIRRMRFALKLFAPFVDAKKCYEIRESLGALNSKTGEVRELDIAIERVEKISAKIQLAPRTRKKFFRELSSRYAKARKSMSEVLISPRYQSTVHSVRQFIRELLEVKDRPPEDRNIDRIFNRLTKKYIGRLSRWRRWNIKKLSSKDIHKIRIDFKRARYLMEFMSMLGAAQGDFKKEIALFTSFQDILGKYHDAFTVVERIKEISKNIDLDNVGAGKIIKEEKKRAQKMRLKFTKKWAQSFVKENL